SDKFGIDFIRLYPLQLAARVIGHLCGVKDANAVTQLKQPLSQGFVIDASGLHYDASIGFSVYEQPLLKDLKARSVITQLGFGGVLAVVLQSGDITGLFGYIDADNNRHDADSLLNKVDRHFIRPTLLMRARSSGYRSDLLDECGGVQRYLRYKLEALGRTRLALAPPRINRELSL